MVKPNAEVIPSQHSLTVKIQTQNPITSVSTARLPLKYSASNQIICLCRIRRNFPPIDSWCSWPSLMDKYPRANCPLMISKRCGSRPKLRLRLSATNWRLILPRKSSMLWKAVVQLRLLLRQPPTIRLLLRSLILTSSVTCLSASRVKLQTKW